jgi:hypothetical protein
MLRYDATLVFESAVINWVLLLINNSHKRWLLFLIGL